VKKPPIINDICYKHDNKQPVEKIKTYGGCEWYGANDKTYNVGAVTCEVDLMTNEYAWFNERYQAESTPEQA